MSVALLPGELANALLRVRFAWLADLLADPATWVWSDVTTDVWFSGPITIAPLGRGDWLSQSPPAQCTLRLNNVTGAYSRGPGSKVRDNTPIQVQVSTDNGATWRTRFQGEAPSFVPRWDANGGIPYVVVKAYGRLWRLNNGKRETRKSSPLTRATLAAATSSNLFQFWPCEDGSTAKRAGSAITGGPPLLASGTYSFAAINPTTEDPGWIPAGLPIVGTQPIPKLSDGGSLSGSFSPGNASAWAVQFNTWTPFNDSASNPALVRQFVEWQTPNGTFVRWRVQLDYSTGTTSLVAYRPDGSSSTVSAVGQFGAGFVEYVVTAAQSGGNINVSLTFNGVVRTGTFAGTLSGVGGWKSNPDVQVTTTHFGVGQVKLWNQASAPIFNISPFDPTPVAWNSFTNELVTDRLTRLGVEGVFAVAITGTSTVTMGAQPVGGDLDLVRECEAADGGQLYDGLGPGIGYVTRSAKYNQAAAIVLNMAAGDVFGPFEPEDDDQLKVNLATVKRTNGSEATFEDVTGPQGTNAIGDKPNAPTVNLASDAGLLNMAAWLVRLGTAGGVVPNSYRYPKLKLNFKSRPSLLAPWVANVALASRVDVQNVSSAALQHPPGDVLLLIEGVASEVITPQTYDITANTSFYDPWIVDALNQSFRLELAAQRLHLSLAPGSATLSLETDTGHQAFTTNAAYPADFPCDLLVGGWRIHVTAAAAPVAGVQSLTIDPSPNAVTIPLGTAVNLLRPAALAR